MKKLTVILLSAFLAFSLTACGSSGQNGKGDKQESSGSADGADGAEENSSGSEEEAVPDTEGNSTESGEEAEQDTEENSDAGAEVGNTAGAGNILVAYFSVMETDGVDTVGGASRVAVDGETLGNNQYIAQLIQKQVGGDLFAIETAQEYPTTHEPLLDFAYEEKADNARPELAAHIESPDSYDVIFLGFPNWNADLPMPLYTFLEEYDFSGKTIIPFTTHGGSRFSRTIQTIAELQPNAEVVFDGLSISRDSVAGAESEVADWVHGLGLSNE